MNCLKDGYKRVTHKMTNNGKNMEGHAASTSF